MSCHKCHDEIYQGKITSDSYLYCDKCFQNENKCSFNTSPKLNKNFLVWSQYSFKKYQSCKQSNECYECNKICLDDYICLKCHQEYHDTLDADVKCRWCNKTISETRLIQN